MFRRNEEEREGPIQPQEVRMSDAGSEVTVVGQGARLDGTVVSAGSLRVDGQVKGKITAEGDVTLAPPSKVDADIHASNVTIAGTFKGNIVAKGKAEIARGGHVEGNISSKNLVVAEGAVFSGQSIMGERAAQAAPQSAQPAQAPAKTEEPAAERQGPKHAEAARR